MTPRPAATRGEAVLASRRQGILEHLRVELEGLAIRIDEGAREEGSQKRGAQGRGGGEELVDPAILGPSQTVEGEARAGEESRRVIGAAMGRGEDHRHALAPRDGGA